MSVHKTCTNNDFPKKIIKWHGLQIYLVVSFVTTSTIALAKENFLMKWKMQEVKLVYMKNDKYDKTNY